MSCPRCGNPVPAGASRCPICAGSIASPAAVTGVLTPPLPGADADATRVSPVLTPSGDDGATLWSPSEPRHQDEAATTPGATAIAPAVPGDGGPLAPGQTFGSRYHIIRTLGVGGMGAVYQAWDAELGVTVALKVIRPEIMADPGTATEVERRFKRELLLARQVTHTNVVRIHDLGQIDGIKYITMSYVEGADLSTILKRDGRLPVQRVLRIARDVVSGLVEAHKAGVVHRDLKPANIMIDANGDALIMDFGIARSSVTADVAAVAATVEMLPAGMRKAAMAAHATHSGAVVGTLEYMAPEQARGLEVDQRADIYALGLMLYDMLVGREHRAQHTDSAIAELRARMEQAPPGPRTVIPEIPEPVDRLISRCLQPDPTNRYLTTEELAGDLARLDDDGEPLPEPRRFTPKLIAAAVVVVAALVTGTWWLTRTPPPEKPHDPVSVLIADFQNGTNDSTFDNTLAQNARRALEGASFISAYDRTRLRGVLGVQAPPKLDAVAAREIALKQGLGVLVSGSIQLHGTGYDISVSATQTVTGNVIAAASDRASSKADVLAAATRLIARVRKALGDRTSESAQLFAMRSLTTSSLDVVKYYAAAVEAQAQGKIDDARQNYLKAVQLDPKFGLGYQGLAVVSRNMGRAEDADKYIKTALQYLDGMTDRERLATRGYYDRLIGDNAQCANEYGELLARYPADAIAHNQRAGCLQKMRNLRGATEEQQKAVQMLPNLVGLRINLALLRDLAGDFAGADEDLKALPTLDARALQALAYSQVGRGLLPEATQTYARIATMGAQGASMAASGLGDVAIYEGRFGDAVRILDGGAAADLAASNPDKAAIKLVAVAYAQLARGQKQQAVAAADDALSKSKSMAVRFLAARIFVDAGELNEAKPLATALSSELPAEPQAHGKIIEGLIALKSGNARDAIRILTSANGIVDTWFGHYDLGRAYLEAGALPQADSELDRCITRRGEALSLMDEGPTDGLFPMVYYAAPSLRKIKYWNT